MVKEIFGVKFYDPKEISKLLGIHKDSINAMFRKGRLKGKKIGNIWYMKEADIKDYLDID